MHAYTVRKTRPSTDEEFQAYADLLEQIGVDLANAPRTLEPGTANRWLYVWKSKVHAERFARSLGSRLRDSSWSVHEFELPREESGPLAPLTVLSIPVNDGTIFKLEANSQARVMKHYPHARLCGEFFQQGEAIFSEDGREDFERQDGPVWVQAIKAITGIPEEAIDRLGGIRIVRWNREVLHERLPADVPK